MLRSSDTEHSLKQNKFYKYMLCNSIELSGTVSSIWHFFLSLHTALSKTIITTMFARHNKLSTLFFYSKHRLHYGASIQPFYCYNTCGESHSNNNGNDNSEKTQIFLSDSCVQHIIEHCDARDLDKHEYKLRVKLNKRTNDPSEIGKFFFTDYLDEEKDIVFERDGAFVVIDKDSLEAFTRMNLQMVDYVSDPENIARSRFLITKKREW